MLKTITFLLKTITFVKNILDFRPGTRTLNLQIRSLSRYLCARRKRIIEYNNVFSQKRGIYHLFNIWLSLLSEHVCRSKCASQI